MYILHFISIFKLFSFDKKQLHTKINSKNSSLKKYITFNQTNEKIICISSTFLGLNVIDISKLDIKQENIINQKFLFSSKTTQFSEIESEIKEIENDEYRYCDWKNAQIGLTIGGSAIGMWFAYKGLGLWEKWMQEQEQKDIQEEIEMTGTYISPEAGNVETSIDPITGKKIYIKSSEKKETS